MKASLLFLFLFPVLFTNFILISCEESLIPEYNIKELINRINTPIGTKKDHFKSIITNVKAVMNEYAFIDILKAPPNLTIQGKKYFTPVDIIGDLDNLYKEISETMGFYEFHQKLMKIIASARDFHISFRANGKIGVENWDNLTKVTIISPFYYIINMEEIQNVKVFKVIPILNELINYLEIEKDIPGFDYELFLKMEGVPLKTINGKDPIDYIREFGKEYLGTKNINTKFTITKEKMKGFDLATMPLNIDELNKLELVFNDTDNTTITTQYIPLILTEMVNKNTFLNYLKNAEKKEKDNEESENFFEFLENENKEYKKNKKLPVDFNLYLKRYYKKYPSKRQKKLFMQNIKSKLPLMDDYIWDYSSEDETFKCKIDDENKLNFYYQSSFLPDNLNEEFLKNLAEKCIAQIENNTYPIVVIDDINVGGSLVLSSIMQEAVQGNYRSINLFSTRIGKYAKEICESSMPTIFPQLYDFNNLNFISNCEEFLNENEIITDVYKENNVTHEKISINRTKQKLLFDYEAYPWLIQMNKEVKNKRKPTDIIVFTDGYSFSATSLFIKSLYYFGGAIIVGYNGDPHELNEEGFDASQSPTFILQNLTAIPEAVKLDSLGYHFFSLSYGPAYLKKYNENEKLQIPLEFTFEPVNLRLKYFNRFNYLSYSELISYINEIFESSKISCFTGRNLKLMDSKCDLKLPKNTHGGFSCGSDYRWNYSDCQPFYCDDGYYFDYDLKRCIPYILYQENNLKLEEIELKANVEQLEAMAKELDEKEKELLKKEKDIDKKKKKNNRLYKGSWAVFGITIFLIVFAITFSVLRSRRNKGSNLYDGYDGLIQSK